jgi:hypothetical protein
MSFNFAEIWAHMPLIGKFIAFGLFMMMVSFIGVTVERLIAFSRSAKESRAFAMQAGKLLEEWKVEEIVPLADESDGAVHDLALDLVQKLDPSQDVRPDHPSLHPRLRRLG